jgi:vWA-MoxR associated protein C-terminal domain
LEGRATALRGTPPKQIKRIRIRPNSTNLSRLFDEGEGLCYAAFVFGRPTDALRNERQVMNRLVAMMGVPYLYWLQRAPNGDWPASLDARLGLWLAKCEGLGDFPATLREERGGGEEFASYGALLWDDPSFVRFTPKNSPNPG